MLLNKKATKLKVFVAPVKHTKTSETLHYNDTIKYQKSSTFYNEC